jgi:phosphatidylinositol alpha-1,6-mannosyltransferase
MTNLDVTENPPESFVQDAVSGVDASAVQARDGGAAGPSRSLVVTRDYFPPQVGGISTMMWRICEQLGPQRVSCLVGNLPPGCDAVPSSVPVHRADLPFSTNLVSKLVSLAATWPRVLLSGQINVLQFATCEDAYWGTYFNRMMGLPFVVYAHGNEILSAAANSWGGARRALRRANAVFANSRYTASLLTDRIGVKPERVKILHPGCDPDEFSPGAPDASLYADSPLLRTAGPMLLTVGNIVERKGHDLVLKCLPELLKRWSDLVYVVVGEGPNRRPLEQLAQSLGVSGSVCFVGRADERALCNYYRRCDVMVMPSRLRARQHDVEGFGIVFLEANACGKPAIGGRCGGMADAIVHGETGFVVDSNDSADLLRHLQLLLSDRQLAQRFGATGRRRVVAELSWSAVADRVAEVTDEMAARGRRRERAH